MTRRQFDVIEEPRGELLRQSLHALARFSSTALVVVRDDLELAESGHRLLSRLRPHLLAQTRCSAWPGTILLGHKATAHRYVLNTPVLASILAAADGLYGWQQPALPEDLALLRPDGTTVLGSIAHEHDAYLEITEEEHASLAEEVPRITKIVRERTTGT